MKSAMSIMLIPLRFMPGAELVMVDGKSTYCSEISKSLSDIGGFLLYAAGWQPGFVFKCYLCVRKHKYMCMFTKECRFRAASLNCTLGLKCTSRTSQCRQPPEIN